jgi:predicted dinucleotide-utilizing enzyme
VGIIGCGAIGAELAKAICSGKAGGASLSVLFDLDAGSLASIRSEGVKAALTLQPTLDTLGQPKNISFLSSKSPG